MFHRLGAHRSSPLGAMILALSIALMIMDRLPAVSSQQGRTVEVIKIRPTVGPVARNRINALSLAMKKHFGLKKTFTVSFGWL